MVLGPLEYLVVGFEDSRFTGQILAELRAAQEKGIIRVVDLCVIAKDEQGNVTERELSELSGEEATELSPLAGNVMGLLADEDIQQLAADIPNKSAAGLLLFEKMETNHPHALDAAMTLLFPIEGSRLSINEPPEPERA